MTHFFLILTAAFALQSDINRDGRTDLQDLLIFAQEWLQEENQVGHYCLQFDGETGRVTVPNASQLNVGTGDFTISFWAENAFNSTGAFFSKRGDNAHYYGSYQDAGYNPQQFVLELWDGGLETVYVPIDIPIGTQGLTHICVTCDRDGNAIGYLNGVAVSTTDISAIGNLDNVEDFVMGCDAATGMYLTGQMDDFRIYKRILSDKEVLAIYRDGWGTKYTGVSVEGGAASCAFDFDEGSGTTVTDSVSGLTGTLSGGVSWQEGGTYSVNCVMVYYDADDSGWILADVIEPTTNYEEYPVWLNVTCKRIKFKFEGIGGHWRMREYGVMDPEVQDNR